LSLREGPFGDIRPPIRWVAGVALVVVAIAALALFLGDHRQSSRAGAYSIARRAAQTVASPVGEGLSTPLRWLGAAGDWIGDYVFAGTQNHALKAELARAHAWRDQALALSAENARYRALMGVRTDPPIPMVFGRTILDARGPFSNARLADVGADRGVVEGNPVLSEHGLVGRVVGVSANASRVLLLTDVESRVPVLLPRTNGRAILTGDGGPNPALAFLRTHEPPREGDRILTSGDGGVFPRGLPVGSAVRGSDGVWRVALDGDAAPIDFVQILLFKDFSQLQSPAALAPTALPTTATAPPPPSPTPPTAPPAVRQTAAASPAAAKP
jgi:rod shape-determining protein MreC